jgi:hypothetical protein
LENDRGALPRETGENQFLIYDSRKKKKRTEAREGVQETGFAAVAVAIVARVVPPTPLSARTVKGETPVAGIETASRNAKLGGISFVPRSTEEKSEDALPMVSGRAVRAGRAMVEG